MADRSIREAKTVEASAYHEALVHIQLHHPGLGNQLDQVRSVYRVARASVLSFLIAAITIPYEFASVAPSASACKTLVIVLFFLCCAAGSFWAWRHLRSSYLQWVSIAKAREGIFASEKPDATRPAGSES